jgi:hypothetical protein
MPYYLQTPIGAVEISEDEYTHIKLDELMGDYHPSEYYLEYFEAKIAPKRRLPKGV